MGSYLMTATWLSIAFLIGAVGEPLGNSAATEDGTRTLDGDQGYFIKAVLFMGICTSIGLLVSLCVASLGQVQSTPAARKPKQPEPPAQSAMDKQVMDGTADIFTFDADEEAAGNLAAAGELDAQSTTPANWGFNPDANPDGISRRKTIMMMGQTAHALPMPMKIFIGLSIVSIGLWLVMAVTLMKKLGVAEESLKNCYEELNKSSQKSFHLANAKAFSDADANQDGTVSKDEAKAIGISAAAFDAADVDKDGHLNVKESANAKAFSDADDNRDGTVSKDEAKAIGVSAAAFEAADVDKDGQLTVQELANAKAFSDADVNRDGTVSKDEAKAIGISAAAIDAADVDKDGQLTVKELGNAKAFSDADVNRDGTVSKDEAKANRIRRRKSPVAKGENPNETPTEAEEPLGEDRAMTEIEKIENIDNREDVVFVSPLAHDATPGMIVLTYNLCEKLPFLRFHSAKNSDTVLTLNCYKSAEDDKVTVLSVCLSSANSCLTSTVDVTNITAHFDIPLFPHGDQARRMKTCIRGVFAADGDLVNKEVFLRNTVPSFRDESADEESPFYEVTYITTGQASQCSGQWSNWSACTSTCGGGMQMRMYSVPANVPGDLRAACDFEHGEAQSQTCNMATCPEESAAEISDSEPTDMPSDGALGKSGFCVQPVAALMADVPEDADVHWSRNFTCPSSGAVTVCYVMTDILVCKSELESSGPEVAEELAGFVSGISQFAGSMDE